MRIGIPIEPDARQPLVAATPDTVAKLIKLGYDVDVQAGAGDDAACGVCVGRRGRAGAGGPGADGRCSAFFGLFIKG